WRTSICRNQPSLLATPLRRRSWRDRQETASKWIPIDDRRRQPGGLRRSRSRIDLRRSRPRDDEATNGLAGVLQPEEPPRPLGERLWPAQAGHDDSASEGWTAAVLPADAGDGGERTGVRHCRAAHQTKLPEDVHRHPTRSKRANRSSKAVLDTAD